MMKLKLKIYKGFYILGVYVFGNNENPTNITKHFYDALHFECRRIKHYLQKVMQMNVQSNNNLVLLVWQQGLKERALFVWTQSSLFPVRSFCPETATFFTRSTFQPYPLSLPVHPLSPFSL